MAAPDKNLAKAIEENADGVKSKLKKTNTNEKTWHPTAADIKEDKTSK